MPFQKGNAGGPGRPKQKPFLEWCGKWTREKAEQFLFPIAEDPKNKGQLEAIKLIMAYGVGKPVETQVVEADVTSDTGSSVESLRREIADIIGPGSGEGVKPDGQDQVAAGK